MNINLNLCKYFFVTAKCNSFTEASKILYVSQPALSYNIKSLENQLGYNLFYRNKEGITLTEKGLDLYSKLMNIYNILDNNSDLEIQGTVRLSISPLFYTEVFSKCLEEIERLFPKITLNIKVQGYDEMINDLYNNKTDIIISCLNFTDNKYCFEYIKNRNLKSCLVKDKKYKDNKIYNYKDLLKEEILLVQGNKISNDFMEKHPDIKRKYCYTTPYLINSLLKENRIGLVPYFVAKNDDRIKLIDTEIDLPTINYSVTYKKEKENPNILAIYNYFLTSNMFDEE